MELTLAQIMIIWPTLMTIKACAPNLIHQMNYWVNENPSTALWFVNIILEVNEFDNIINYLQDAIDALNQ